MTMPQSLDRYRALIPDWDRFRRAAAAPEPETFRVRAGRIEPGELARRLEARGFRLERLAAPPGFFRVLDGPHPISQTLEHWLGLVYVQQAVTGLAAYALTPEPGDRILDMCAAPGGKTLHLADLTGDGARLVAADRNEKRLRALLGNLYRLGHAGVLVVAADGRRFPGGARFDRVLVDAPCSAEGNLRRYGGEPPEQSASFLAYATRLQEALLRRAVGLTSAGGTVLYVTCTFNPDENEAVVDRVLRELPLALEPIDLGPEAGDETPHAPGLTAFEGRRFHPDLALAWRLYPYHLDSGGLFMARLRVLEAAGRTDGGGVGTGRPSPAGAGGDGDEGWRPVPPVAPGDGPDPEEARARAAAARALLHEEFGVPPGALDSLGWLVRKDSLWAHRLSAWPLEAWTPGNDWRFVSLGIRAFKADRRFGERPTNEGLRLLGPHLEERVVDLDPGDCLRLLTGDHPTAADAPGGLVALRVDGRVVGRGVVGRGRLRHEIPKARAARLRTVLERREGARAAGQG